MFRRWLLVLVCVAMSAQTLAIVPPTQGPCPMADHTAAAPAAAAPTAGHDAPARADCCTDADALAATNQSCKPGQECGLAAALLPSLTVGRAAEGPGAGPPQSTGTRWLAGPPGCPWRPPTSV